MTASLPTRAVGLVRLSREEQEAGHSADAQRRAIETYCAEHGWDLVHVYEAIGESAFTDDLTRRRSMDAALRSAERGEYDVFLFHESSRLARDESAAQEILKRLGAAGVRLVNMSSAIDYATPEGRVFYGIESVLNAYWSRKAGEHIRKGKREKWLKGLTPGALPFGYVHGPDGVPVIDDHEAEAVRYAYRARLRGQSLQSIANDLNRMGYHPRSRIGNAAFVFTTVRSMLDNPFYRGAVVHHGLERPGLHEPLVSRDVWDAAQQRQGRGQPVGSSDALCTGLVRCETCGQKLWIKLGGNRNRPRWYYQEPHSGRKAGAVRCERGNVSAHATTVDEQVSAIIRAIGLDRRWLQAAARAARRPEGQSDRTRQSLEAEKARATNAYIAGAIPESQWQAICTGIDLKLAALPASREGLTEMVASVRSFAELWDGAGLASRREAVGIILQAVHVDLPEGAVRVEPRPGYAALFAHRAAWAARVVLAPDRNRAQSAPYHSPAQWRYTPADLGVEEAVG